MIVIDTTTLLVFLDPSAKPPLDPATGVPVTHFHERVKNQIEALDKAGQKILIPTPVMAEFLAGAGVAKQAMVDAINGASVFEVVPFDQRAAVEFSVIWERIMAGKRKKKDREPRVKTKFDSQILAIAKSRRADRLYTDDDQLATRAQRLGIAVTRLWDFELPKGTIPLPLETPAPPAR